MQEKIYRGDRTEGTAKATVNGKALQHIVWHSPTGFEWGYGGSWPAHLAYSILFDCLGEKTAGVLYQQFKWDFVAGWGDFVRDLGDRDSRVARHEEGGHHMTYETIKVPPATKSRFHQRRRELAAGLRPEVTQDELVARFPGHGNMDSSAIRSRILREIKVHDSPHYLGNCTRIGTSISLREP